MGTVKKTDYLVVGSGANGISPAVFLRNSGRGNFRIITKDSDFGGVWHVNRYPGCLTDIPAYVYQLSYAKSYSWTASHPPASEMAEYLRGVARDNGLYEHTDFESELLDARWLEEECCWEVETSKATYHCNFLILSTGFLEELNFPDLKGASNFAGKLFHAAQWPAGYTGENDRIAVLGTSASGVQIVPEMQKVAEKVYVFQRTPCHLLPLNRAEYSDDQVTRHVEDHAILDELREATMQQFELAAYEGLHSAELPEQIANRVAMVDEHRAKHVADPELRQKLTPDYALGCKRPTRTDLYYGALSCDNVELVDEGAVALNENSIISSSGQEFEVDTVVMATGYKWGGKILHRIHRRDGVPVAEAQAGHRRAYKSVSISGCPNLFLVGGPGANGAVWHGYAPGEIMARYLLMALDYMDEHGLEALEVKEEAEANWKAAADEILSKAPIVTAGCANYFLDESGNDMANWPGTMADMEKEMSSFVADDYFAVERR